MTLVPSWSNPPILDHCLHLASCCNRVVVLPEPQNDPPSLAKFAIRALIATPVRIELGCPPLSVRLREGSVRWASMPETPVDVDGDSCSREDHISARSC